MSVSKHIACIDCKEHLWIGQTSESFYSGEPHTMEALRVFLFKHENHNLKFVSEFYDSYFGEDTDEWTEIDSDDYKEQPPEETL